MNTINLYNPNDKPFGKLSNNSYHPIEIDGKNYSTVTNYIFSNMLVNPISKIILQNAEITGSSAENKEFIRAIDYLLDLEKKSKEENLEKTVIKKIPREVMLRKNKIAYLTRITGNKKEYYENMSNEEINKENAKIFREQREKLKNMTDEEKQEKQEKLEKQLDIQQENKIAEFQRETEEEENINLLSPEEREQLYENLLTDLTEAETNISKLELELEYEPDKQEELNYYLDRKYKIEQKLKEKKKKDYINYISNQVRKPFENINLQELKDNHLEQSKLNVMGIYKLMDYYLDQEYFETISNVIKEGFSELILGEHTIQVNQNGEKRKITTLKYPEISKTLLLSGNSTIIYRNNFDTFLGLNDNGQGQNIIGKTLMQIRHQLRNKNILKIREKEEEDKKKYIYNIFLAYIILNEEIEKNRNNLETYVSYLPDKIIQKYGISNIKVSIPSQETVMQMYNNGNLNEIVMQAISNPNSLVINVRKNGLEKLKSLFEEDKRNIIFNCYIKYIIEKNFEEEIKKETDRLLDIQIKINSELKNTKKEITENVIKDAISQQLQKLEQEELNNLKNRVIDLFKLGMLSASLSNNIDNELKLLKEPMPENESNKESDRESYRESNKESYRESDRESYRESNKESYRESDRESYRESNKESDRESDNSDSDSGSDYNPTSKSLKKILSSDKKKSLEQKEQKEQKEIEIEIHSELNNNSQEFKPFNPKYYNGMLTINNRRYPTIEHYMLAKLLSNTGFKRTVNSKGIILNVKGMGIENAYQIIKNDDITENIKEEYSTFKNFNWIEEIYINENFKTNKELSSILTVIALNKKFEDIELQNLLLLTDNSEIRWKSPYKRYSNLIYGTEKQEENYVGNVLMDIREQIRIHNNSVKELEIKPNNIDIFKFIENDSFIKSWIEMKLKDMLGVVYKFQQYFKIKNNIDYNVLNDTKFTQLIESVLDNIFQPCNVLFENFVEMPVPQFIYSIVSKSKGMHTGVKPVYLIDNKGRKTYNKTIQQKIKETEKEINYLENKLAVFTTTISHTKEEADAFNTEQREEFGQFFINIKDKEDKNEQLIKLKNKQKEDYNKFWGIKRKIDKEVEKETQDEINNLQDKLYSNKKDINGQYIGYITRLKDRERLNNQLIKKISQIYWNRITSMLLNLIQMIGNATQYNIKKNILKFENELSMEKKCIKIISNDEDNCIISAILNLLYSISIFKYKFSKTEELEEDDIKLAVSIILNTELDIQKNIITENKKEEKESESELEEMFPEEVEEMFPEIEEEKEEELAFGFKSSNSDIENIKSELRKKMQNNDKDYTNIAEEIIKNSSVIKKSNNKIKQNRINFFASIK